MNEAKLHRSAEIKRGTGERIFLAFAGKRHPSSDHSQLPAKSSFMQEALGILLLFVTAGMIGIVVWRFVSGAR